MDTCFGGMLDTFSGVSEIAVQHDRNGKRRWVNGDDDRLQKEEVMSQERLSMRKIGEVLRLSQEAKLSNGQIAGSLGISVTEQLKVHWFND